MRARRRNTVATNLHSMTTQQLEELMFFGDCENYAPFPGDRERAREILRARGYFQRTRHDNGQSGPEAA